MSKAVIMCWGEGRGWGGGEPHETSSDLAHSRHKSHSLKLAYLSVLPCSTLQVALSALPQSVLTGETSRLSMEVYNVGQVSLNSLRLTSSLGPLLLMDKVKSSYNSSFHLSSLVSRNGEGLVTTSLFLVMLAVFC